MIEELKEKIVIVMTQREKRGIFALAFISSPFYPY
jgi:hypothetical protein